MNDTRQSTAMLTYPGNVVDSIMIRTEKPMGPTLLGEWWFPLEAEYHPDYHHTKVGFSLMPPPDWDSSNFLPRGFVARG